MDYRSIRIAYASFFAFLTWAAALAAAETWYGLNPDEPLVRAAAVAVASLIFFHVKALGQRHVTDAAHAVAFPMKQALAFGHALFLSWLTVRAVSVGAAVFVFGENLVTPPIEFTATVVLAWFSLGSAELVYFHTPLDRKPAWLDPLIRFLRRLARPNQEAAERLVQEQHDYWRHVERRFDEHPIQGAEEARRRAEGQL